MIAPRLGHANLGLGVGLRTAHFAHVLEHFPAVDWFEIISENFIDSQGRPRYVLDQIAERYPVVMHGVSLSIGSTDPLDFDYLARLKRLADAIGPRWISDHLCWTGVLGLNAHDLLPLPLNEETLAHVVARVRTVQDFLERPLVLENPSSYVTFAASTISEWEFLRRMADEADCGLLLDVNNVYVSSVNHDFDPVEYIERLPHERIVQCHLAGHANCETHLIDTHDNHVIDPVWRLYRRAHALTGGIATLLEWDAGIPEFPVVHAEVLKARQYMTPDGDEPLPADRPAAGLFAGASPGEAFDDGRDAPSAALRRARSAMTPHDDSPLARLQRWMQAVITHPGGVAEGAASDDARRHLADSPSGIEQVIARSQRLTSEERLAIYSHAYFARLLECLRAVFPFVAKTIGEEAFDDLALGYLERYPSRSYTLDRLGAEFPRYLEETRPDRNAEGRPTETWPDFLIELAKLEWVIGEVFDGPGVEGQSLLSADDLTAIPAERWPQARLKFVPCWRLLAFRFPLNDFYTALRNEEPPEIPEPAETFLALTRRDFIVRRHRLDRTQFELLSALASGEPIGAAIEQAAKVAGPDLEGFAANLQSSFRDWTAAGFFQATDL